jgi:hypothetical protein
LRGKRSRRRCAPGVKRSRARSIGVDGVEACSVSGRGGGGVEDLKRASSKNLLSAERAACAPDIYIGGQMREARRSFFRRVMHYF